MPYAFVAAVSTEVIASTSGLGHLVKGSSTIMNSAGMFSAMFALLFVSLAASVARELRGGEVALETVNGFSMEGTMCVEYHACDRRCLAAVRREPGCIGGRSGSHRGQFDLAILRVGLCREADAIF